MRNVGPDVGRWTQQNGDSFYEHIQLRRGKMNIYDRLAILFYKITAFNVWEVKSENRPL